MPSYTPFFVGTALFVALAGVACALSAVWIRRRGAHRRYRRFGDPAPQRRRRAAAAAQDTEASVHLAYALITIAAICMWIMWAMTWLMQVNPLIRPQLKDV